MKRNYAINGNVCNEMMSRTWMLFGLKKLLRVTYFLCIELCFYADEEEADIGNSCCLYNSSKMSYKYQLSGY